ncbi:MAG: DNA recombination protein RmuC [Rickettsiales bacterium]
MILLYGSGVAVALVIFYQWYRIAKTKAEIANLNFNLKAMEETRKDLDRELNQMFEEKIKLQEKTERLISENGKYESKVESLEDVLKKLDKENTDHEENFNKARQELYEVQKQLELKMQAMKEMQKRMDDWDKSRSESISHAKAAIFEAGSKLSNELIEKHKKETTESEQKLKKSQQELQGQFEKIISSVAVLNSEVKTSKETVDHVKRALLTPAGAGSLSEITLENILNASGLDKKRDFIMQYSLNLHNEGTRQRPDAVVFLPADNIMIIDSKASKFFTEIAANQDDESEKTLNAKLKATMRNHLKTLESKDYQESLRSYLGNHKVNHVSNIMFLPSETAIEKLNVVDKDFMHKAWEKDIFPVGPTGLINILTYAKFQISATRQAENHQHIVDEIRKLLNSFSTIYDHARKLGNSLYSATNNFDKFAGSFNTNILPKARNLQKLGVHTQKNKQLPDTLDRFTIVSSGKNDLIEVEEAKENQKQLTDNPANDD